jgi:predicted SnoaL-like aldol condensation-catalyzing enzyme
MSVACEATNKALVLVALDTLFNKRDYRVAEQYWSPRLVLHCAHLAPGRDGLFEFVKAAPATLRYEPGAIVANEDCVIVHGRISGNGRPRNWIIATILRIEDRRVAEQWEVIQDEASQVESKSGHPMFGDGFVESDA